MSAITIDPAITPRRRAFTPEDRILSRSGFMAR